MQYTKQHIQLTVLLIVSIFWAITGNAQKSSESLSLLEKIATPGSDFQCLKLKNSEQLDKESFLKQAKILFNFDEHNELLTKQTNEDALGWVHHRQQQYYKGIPIEGAIYILHEKSGEIQKANGKLLGNLDKEIFPSIGEGEAFQELLNRIGASKYAWEDEFMENLLKASKQDSSQSYCPQSELVFVSPNFDTEASKQRLAYKFDVFSLEPYERYYYYVDAHTGETICKLTRIHENSAQGVAQTNYYGLVNIITEPYNGGYRLHDNTRGNGIRTYSSDNTWQWPEVEIEDSDNNWTDSEDRTGCEAHWASEKVYDYFFDEHNRKSFDDAGATIYSWVNYGVDYVNAFWNGSFMTYGDGNGSSYGPLTCLDVVGHEITHAITERTAGLIYSYESGALNESFSDIFGTVIEFYADPNGGDWYMGEDANYNGNGFRNMKNPNTKNHPDTYLGDYWYTGNQDYGGVHINSGVQNFWFYLLAQGGNGINDSGYMYNVNGIGMEKAAKIAFRNLTVYLTPTSNYYNARTGSVQAASDLYGANSNEVQQVLNAWCAVGVGDCNSSPSGQLSLLTPNGGEHWTVGNTYNILWEGSNNVGPNVRLEYSINGGTMWYIITTSTTNDGLYSWTIPNYPSTVCKMRIISNENNNIVDDSDAYFSIVSPPTPPPPPPSPDPVCNASDLDLDLSVYLPDNGSVFLYTGLENMAFYFWDFNGELVGTDHFFQASFPGTYIVSLVDSCGNNAIDSIEVLTTTSTTNNVWPGDMNYDGVVDIKDTPIFGTMVGLTGTSRINQDIEWYPHPSTDWGTTTDGVDNKHIDADGNGLVDLNDGQAIDSNYGKKHNEVMIAPPNSIVENSPFQIFLQPISVPSFIGNDNVLVWDIVLENTLGTDIAFYGGYFSIDYYHPANVVSNPQVSFANTWLGPSNELFYIVHNDEDDQRLDIGITRLDHQNKIGSGVIGQLSLEINQMGFAGDYGVLNLKVGDIGINNSELTFLPFATQEMQIGFAPLDCPPDLMLNVGTLLDGTYQAANSIATNGVVNVGSGQEVIFKANEADLKEQFAVDLGATFEITIDPCSVNLQTSTNKNNGQSKENNKALWTFELNLKEASDIQLEVMTMKGEKRQNINLGYYEAGTHSLNIDKQDLTQAQLLIGVIEKTKRHYFVLKNN